MKERTRQRIYGLVLGVNFMMALPIAFSSMMNSQDDDSDLLRKTVSYFHPTENKNNDNVASNISTLVIEDESVASGKEANTDDNAKDTTIDAVEGNTQKEDDLDISFTKVDPHYFEDAFFIGDSRTLGIQEYGGLEKTVFFANSGMSVIKLYDTKLKVEGLGKVSFEDALHAKTYGKVYIMLGMNEMGYEFDYLMDKYQTIIDDVKEAQPDAIIYVCANLHLTKDAQTDILNNPDLDRLNKRISEFADDQTIFYLDINPYYDDGEGNLNPEYSTDGVHIYAKYYEEWVNWLCTKAIVK